MPLEIRELIIKAELEGKPSSKNRGLAPAELKKLQKQVIEACLKQLRKEFNNDLINR